MRLERHGPQEGKICPLCKKGNLKLIQGVHPYTKEYLMCDVCDSTYVHREDTTTFPAYKRNDV